MAKTDDINKPTSSSIEKMTEGFILSSATNNNESNDTTTLTSSTSTAIDTPRSVTSSPEEGDDKVINTADNIASELVGQKSSELGGDIPTGKLKRH